jgi:hypothetical protein
LFRVFRLGGEVSGESVGEVAEEVALAGLLAHPDLPGLDPERLEHSGQSDRRERLPTTPLPPRLLLVAAQAPEQIVREEPVLVAGVEDLVDVTEETDLGRGVLARPPCGEREGGAPGGLWPRSAGGVRDRQERAPVVRGPVV